jgi:WD40 repeat protein
MLQVSDARAMAVGGHLIAVAGRGGTVRLFRTRNLSQDVLPAPGGVAPQAGSPCADVVAVSLPPFEDSVVVAYSDHSIRSWSIERKDSVSERWALAPHQQCIWAVAAHASSDKASVVATASQDGSVRLWQCTTTSARTSLGPVQRIAGATALGIHQLGDVISSSPTLTAARPAHGSGEDANAIEPRALAFSASGARLAVGDSAGAVHVYDTSTHALLAQRTAHDGLVRYLAFSAVTQGGVSLLASAGEDGMVHIFDATSDDFTPLQSLNEHEGIGVTCMLFIDGGMGVMTAAQDQSMILRCAIARIMCPFSFVQAQ